MDFFEQAFRDRKGTHRLDGIISGVYITHYICHFFLCIFVLRIKNIIISFLTLFFDDFLALKSVVPF